VGVTLITRRPLQWSCRGTQSEPSEASSRTLEQIEDDFWGDPPSDATHLIRTVYQLRRKSIRQLDAEDLRVLLLQRRSVDILVPVAVPQEPSDSPEPSVLEAGATLASPGVFAYAGGAASTASISAASNAPAPAIPGIRARARIAAASCPPADGCRAEVADILTAIISAGVVIVGQGRETATRRVTIAIGQREELCAPTFSGLPVEVGEN
jgi:hypothetical protein